MLKIDAPFIIVPNSHISISIIKTEVSSHSAHELESISILANDPFNQSLPLTLSYSKDPNSMEFAKVSFDTNCGGFYEITVFSNRNDDNNNNGYNDEYVICTESILCIDLNLERWHLDEVGWSLRDVHLTMETEFHSSILSQISAVVYITSTSKQQGIFTTKRELPDHTCVFSFTPMQYGSYYYQFRFNSQPIIHAPKPIIHIIDPSTLKLVHSFYTDGPPYLAQQKKKVSFILELGAAPPALLKAWINEPGSLSTHPVYLYGDTKSSYSDVSNISSNNGDGAPEVGHELCLLSSQRKQMRCDFIPTKLGEHQFVACLGDSMFDQCPLDFVVMEIIYDTPPLPAKRNHYKSMTNDDIGRTTMMDDHYDEAEKEGDVIMESCDKIETSNSEIRNLAPEEAVETIIEPTKIGQEESSPTFIRNYQEYNDEVYNDNDEYEDEEDARMKYEKEYELSNVEVEDESRDGNMEDAENKIFNDYEEYDEEVEEVISNNYKYDEEEREEYDVKPNNTNDTNQDVEVKVDRGKEVVRESYPSIEGEGLYRGIVSRKAQFSVKPNKDPGKLTVDVRGPDSLARCLIKPIAQSGSYEVEYFPEEVGRYKISILWNGSNVPSSPFFAEVSDPFKIYCVTDRDLFNKILVFVESQSKLVIFDYSLAGHSTMVYRVLHGPIQVKGWVNQNKKEWNFQISAETECQGTIEFLWDGEIVGRVQVRVETAVVGDDNIEDNEKVDKEDCNKISANIPKQLILKGHGLKEAWVGEEGHFMVDCSNMTETNVQISLVHEVSGERIDIKREKLSNGVYSCRYRADTPGEYKLIIKDGDRPIHCSNTVPVKVWHSDPSRSVVCSGDGLCRGSVGKDVLVSVDTSAVHGLSNKGSMISVDCTDPAGHPVVCDLRKKSSSEYIVKLRPSVAGRHQLSIMYGKVHVQGSPYSPYFSNIGSIDQLIVAGPGLDASGQLEKTESWFTVDASRAGVGQLSVNVVGPREAFHVEVMKEEGNDKMIRCQYNPTEIGLYKVSVKWNGIEIRESPYMVDIHQ